MIIINFCQLLPLPDLGELVAAALPAAQGSGIDPARWPNATVRFEPNLPRLNRSEVPYRSGPLTPGRDPATVWISLGWDGRSAIIEAPEVIIEVAEGIGLKAATG